MVESLLLLAENLPRDPIRTGQQKHEQDDTRALGFGEEFHSAENRQAWMLIGTAIRSAYGLGIDKVSQFAKEGIIAVELMISLRICLCLMPSGTKNLSERD
jgi:hypothetical protein